MEDDWPLFVVAFAVARSLTSESLLLFLSAPPPPAQGKVTDNAMYDFTMLVDCLSYHVEEARRSYGAVIPSPNGGALTYTKHVPVGVVVCVLTWNFPLLNLGYKLGPILASGCTCVVKPSEMTPVATSRVVSLLAEAGVPAGVVNLVNGTGVDLLETLCASKIPRLLTTIGSTRMGKWMIQYSPSTVKRFSLELGGDAPVLVFADSDLDKAVKDICGLKFANGGQICVSPNRVFVEQSVYDAFLAQCEVIVAGYSYGSGDDKEEGKAEVLQPVVSEQSLERLLKMVEDAAAAGGRVVAGGKRVDRPGYFMQPTVIADAKDGMACQADEIFGPILAVRPFPDGDVDGALRMANDTEFGLSGYVYTKNLDTMLKAENELMCGNVLINGAHYSIEIPHGGLKQSGYGKDISHLALRDYYDVKRVTLTR